MSGDDGSVNVNTLVYIVYGLGREHTCLRCRTHHLYLHVRRIHPQQRNLQRPSW